MTSFGSCILLLNFKIIRIMFFFSLETLIKADLLRGTSSRLPATDIPPNIGTCSSPVCCRNDASIDVRYFRIHPRLEHRILRNKLFRAIQAVNTRFSQ